MVSKIEDCLAQKYFLDFQNSTNKEQVQKLISNVWSSTKLTYRVKLQFAKYVSLWDDISFDAYSWRTSYLYKGIKQTVKKAERASLREPRLGEFTLFLLQNIKNMNLPAKNSSIYCLILTEKNQERRTKAIQVLENILYTSNEFSTIEKCKTVLDGLYSEEGKNKQIDFSSPYGTDIETIYDPNRAELLVRLQEQINESQNRL